ncbi:MULTISPECIES: glycosyltransferase family 2 protein [Streptomycetaceae]|uniref:Transferase n=1 Tax=Streptantibioticus cattleyicolor (strain ATCC 35852 / DSM 46488 / JCM 4925 / NBRC 14057 / NRRL 8057) TaxID=1003195 RepID=F8K2K1_STREN|nr:MULTISPECIES: glycosyltransferase [Streptomycetaceae]AEW97512.1 transferase [Streptantibioticus cattleyicolor NRRL 8057 = DSM 46488]MYS61945.1 glycosyltransferase [Streptomyces sp. SID5468]CCB77836.1 putative transferase [Streptantibioticus cattleyicolor NRRL 8057 = DSM 46488]
MTPPVGIVVITRDRRERLLRTLARLTTLPQRPPVVVVDNASTDGTAAAVRDAFPAVRLLTPGRNLGACGRNLGTAALDTPYVAFADDDSWWEPQALTRIAALFTAHPRLALIAAAVRVGPDGHRDPVEEALAAAPLGTEPDLPGPSALGFLACASAVRRRAFEAVGGFHPLLHFGGEEELLALDLAADGWGLAYCPEVVAHHDPGPQPRTGRAARLRRNALLTAWLRRPLRHAIRATATLTRQAVTDPAARRALPAAVVRIPAALRHRKPLPPGVEARARSLEGVP